MSVVNTRAPRPSSALWRSRTSARRLVRHVWHTVKKRNAWGGYETIMSSSPRTSARVHPARPRRSPRLCVLTAEKAGYHEIVAEAVDAAGRKTVTMTPSGWWARGLRRLAAGRDDNKVEVVPIVATTTWATRREVSSRALPRGRRLGDRRAEGVLWQQRLRLQGTAVATPIRIPVTAEMIPNAFVGVVFARGRAGATRHAGRPGASSISPWISRSLRRSGHQAGWPSG
ncbi:MAG: hypothetical protein R3F43_23495 [bacterium]